MQQIVSAVTVLQAGYVPCLVYGTSSQLSYLMRFLLALIQPDVQWRRRGRVKEPPPPPQQPAGGRASARGGKCTCSEQSGARAGAMHVHHGVCLGLSSDGAEARSSTA